MDQLVERESKSVFALIYKKEENSSFLLRWNNNHKVFNFIGGHIEYEDQNDPDKTLDRELKEELGLSKDDYTYNPLFQNALCAKEYSAPYKKFTKYTLYFYRVILKEDKFTTGDTTGKHKREIAWANLAQIKEGKLGDEKIISQFPAKIINSFLPYLPKMNTPVQRVMERINILIKIKDHEIDEIYYLAMKSRKSWADINFISARLRVFDLSKETAMIFPIDIEECSNIVKKELNDTFGFDKAQGKMISDLPLVSYIEYSKTRHQIVWYRHYFFGLTEIGDAHHLLKLKEIELLPLSLLKAKQNTNFQLHPLYELSHILNHFVEKKLWEKDENIPCIELRKDKKFSVISSKIGILFTDLKDYGKLFNKVPEIDEQLIGIVRKKYQHLVSLAIKSNGGYIVKTVGDAFVAIFEITDQNYYKDILRMIKASLNILANDHIELKGQTFELVTRIGINIASEIQEGFVGALDLREYDLFGKEVNIASRLEKKVNELGASINNFIGGLLINLINLKKENILSDIEISNNFKEMIDKSDGETFKRKIIKFQKDIDNDFGLFSIVDHLKEEINALIKEPYTSFKLSDDILSFKVKEGETRCLFIYQSS